MIDSILIGICLLAIIVEASYKTGKYIRKKYRIIIRRRKRKKEESDTDSG